jgi:hypothetical protein
MASKNPAKSSSVVRTIAPSDSGWWSAYTYAFQVGLDEAYAMLRPIAPPDFQPDNAPPSSQFGPPTIEDGGELIANFCGIYIEGHRQGRATTFLRAMAIGGEVGDAAESELLRCRPDLSELAKKRKKQGNP